MRCDAVRSVDVDNIGQLFMCRVLTAIIAHISFSVYT
jgi:hypothetical protein